MSLNSLGVRLASPIKAVSTSRAESPSIFPQSERDDLLAKVESSRESSPIEGLRSGIPSPDPTQRHDERIRALSRAKTRLAECFYSNGQIADPPELSQAPHGKPVRPKFVRSTPPINPTEGVCSFPPLALPDSVSLSALTIQKHFRGFAARKGLSIQNIKEETVFFFEEDYKSFKPDKKIKFKKSVSFDVFSRIEELNRQYNQNTPVNVSTGNSQEFLSVGKDELPYCEDLNPIVVSNFYQKHLNPQDYYPKLV